MAEDTKKTQAVQPKVNWDTSNIRSSYANVCNVTSTREEVVVMFGLSQAWSGNEQEVSVALSDRVILSPFAAKRLALLLSNVIQQYEGRFGALDLAQAQPQPVTPTQAASPASN